MPDQNLLLLGHGSHLDSNSSQPVRAIADRLRPLERFRRVDLAFWKEEPAIARWNDRYRLGDTVIAVPVFISDGYFTREVLPRELGLDSELGSPNSELTSQCVRGVDLRYTRPVGSHRALAEVAHSRAVEAGARRQDAVVLLGHGTKRNPNSERNVFVLAEAVRASGDFAEVVTVFMDQAPEMSRVFDLTSADRVFMVPMFIAEGWHVGQTIPQDLAIDGGELRRGGRKLTYTAPVGTHPAIANVVLQLVDEAMS